MKPMPMLTFRSRDEIIEAFGYSALEYILPVEDQTEELCLSAINEYGGMQLFQVRSDLKTKEMCTLAIGLNGDAIRAVPKKSIDYNMANLAIEDDPMNIQYIPKTILDEKLCIKALIGDPPASSMFQGDIKPVNYVYWP